MWGVLSVVAACAPDAPSSRGNATLPGVAPDSGWRQLYGHQAIGQRGVDGLSHVVPASLHAASSELLLIFREEMQSHEGPTGSQRGWRYTIGADRDAAFDPHVPFLEHHAATTQQFLWNGESPTLFVATEENVRWIRDGRSYYPPANAQDLAPLPERGVGRSWIAKDGTHYAFGSGAYRHDMLQPGWMTWQSLACYPRAGDRPVFHYAENLQVVDGTDRDRPVFVSANGTIRVWSHDPALPRDFENKPGCTRVLLGTDIVAADHAYLFDIGGVRTIVATSSEQIVVYTYANDTLTLAASSSFTAEGAVSVATDGTSLWVGFLDRAHGDRVTVLVQSGATFEPVGERGFSFDLAASDPDFADELVPTPPLLAAFDGRVFVGYAQRAVFGLPNYQYGTLWIATPE